MVAWLGLGPDGTLLVLRGNRERLKQSHPPCCAVMRVINQLHESLRRPPVIEIDKFDPVATFSEPCRCFEVRRCGLLVPVEPSVRHRVTVSQKTRLDVQEPLGLIEAEATERAE